MWTCCPCASCELAAHYYNNRIYCNGLMWTSALCMFRKPLIVCLCPSLLFIKHSFSSNILMQKNSSQTETTKGQKGGFFAKTKILFTQATHPLVCPWKKLSQTKKGDLVVLTKTGLNVLFGKLKSIFKCKRTG